MKKLLLLLLLIPNLVMAENPLDKKGLLCNLDKNKSPAPHHYESIKLWCENNMCWDFWIDGYKVLKSTGWETSLIGSDEIRFSLSSANSRVLNRATLEMIEWADLHDFSPPRTWVCEVTLKKNDVVKHLYEKIKKSKKENKI